MEREEMKRLAMAALQYTVNGEPEPAAAIVEALAGTGDIRTLYGAMCGWAGSAEVALERIHGEPAGAIWSFEEMYPSELTNAPERTFALRFIAAYSNADPATTEALFAAALNASSDQFAGSVASLLQMAADINAEVQQAA